MKVDNGTKQLPLFPFEPRMRGTKGQARNRPGMRSRKEKTTNRIKGRAEEAGMRKEQEQTEKMRGAHYIEVCTPWCKVRKG